MLANVNYLAQLLEIFDDDFSCLEVELLYTLQEAVVGVSDILFGRDLVEIFRVRNLQIVSEPLEVFSERLFFLGSADQVTFAEPFLTNASVAEMKQLRLSSSVFLNLPKVFLPGGGSSRSATGSNYRSETIPTFFK